MSVSNEWGAVAKLSTMEAFTTHYARDAAAAMLQVLSATPSSGREIRIADIACGTGVAAFALVDKLRTTPLPAPVTVLASDISPGMLEKVSERWSALAEGERPAGVRVEAVPACDMTNMSAIPTGSLDGIVCVFGLMFAADPVAALREFKRVLKPGAPAVIATWTTDVSSAAIGLETHRRLRKLRGEEDQAPDFAKPGSGLSLPSEEVMRRVVGDAFGPEFLTDDTLRFEVKCYREGVAVSDFAEFMRAMAKAESPFPPKPSNECDADPLAELLREIISDTPFFREAREQVALLRGGKVEEIVPLVGHAVFTAIRMS